MNRTEFKQRVEAILTEFNDLESRLDLIMRAHDTTVETALEEYEQALNDDTDARPYRSSLECPEDVSLHEVREPENVIHEIMIDGEINTHNER